MVDFFQDYHGIRIWLDKPALEEVGVKTDEPLTMSLSGIRLRSAFNLMLREIGLDWTISNDVLLITSREAAKRHMVTRLYDVRDLVDRAAENEDSTDLGSLMELLTSTISPQSWDASGGPGSIALYEFGDAEVLAIRNTPKVHTSVGTLLYELGELADKHREAERTSRLGNRAQETAHHSHGPAIRQDRQRKRKASEPADPFGSPRPREK